MRFLMALAPVALIVAACTPAAEAPADTRADGYDMAASRDTIATVEMAPDTSYLTAEERQVVGKLIEASRLMSEIYLRQRNAQNPALRAEIAAAGNADVLDMFDRNFGPWDEGADLRPFYGTTAMPDGAGFWPTDLTREELDEYLAAHPDQREAILSPYTVVKRQGENLVTVPYSVEYREFLEPAARLLREAAEITTNPSLRRFLALRADSFLSDDYFDSEMAWMDLSGTPIEVAIGPYEVYTDRLMGVKTAFESFVTLRNPAESEALRQYVSYLRDMEGNLPIADQYKNFRRGFESPIAVADQIQGGGDNVPGVQTIAFNLPNDERVREAKGAKKVILANVLGAKFDMILQPMGALVLAPDQAGLVQKKYMELETLFHELAHSLGPGSITLDGRQTTVDAELRDLHGALEESKADVMGVYNILYLMDRGVMPVAEKDQLFATYLTGIFRAVRFGLEEAHAQGAAVQYSFLLEKGAFRFDQASGRYLIDPAKMESGLRELLTTELMLQARGDYAGTRAFFDRYGALDDHGRAVVATMNHIPVDIRPVYPRGV